MDREYIGFEATPAAWALLGSAMRIVVGIAIGALTACYQVWGDVDLPVGARHWAAGVGGATIATVAVCAVGFWAYAGSVRRTLEAQRPDRDTSPQVGARYLMLNYWYKSSAVLTLSVGVLMLITPMVFGLAGLQ